MVVILAPISVIKAPPENVQSCPTSFTETLSIEPMKSELAVKFN